jgi:hypothetical protein
MRARVLGRGEGRRRYTARGSVMLFKAVPSPGEERELMARFGMEAV